MLVALDSPVAADRLSEALRAAGSSVGVLVEIDVGMGRGGVRSVDEAAELARHIDGTDRLELRGVMGYEGHAVLERDPTVRGDLAMTAASALASAASALRDARLRHRDRLGGRNQHVRRHRVRIPPSPRSRRARTP